MPGSVIVGGARTPIGKLSGALKAASTGSRHGAHDEHTEINYVQHRTAAPQVRAIRAEERAKVAED